MLSSEEILEQAASDGSIDVEEWPRVLDTLLKRLHDIVHNDFPLPIAPYLVQDPPPIDPEVVASTPPTLLPSSRDENDDTLPDADENNENEPPPNSQHSTKENDAPTDIAARRTLPSFHVNPVPSEPTNLQSPTLPPDLWSTYSTSTHILSTAFANSPPYTLQRLAELVLYPRSHYRFLPAYLRALDRIVSVSSPVSDFPLPTLQTSAFLTNGDVAHAVLGSDESLGGALLTPIPWLRDTTLAAAAGREGELHSSSTETIEGPNGAGSVETVTVTVNGVISSSHSPPEQSDTATTSQQSMEAQLREQGAVTQGELLRQEQEAGVVLSTQAPARRPVLLAGGAVAVGREDARILRSSEIDAEELDMDLPHARGPQEIGMEDMGPQQQNNDGLDIEAAVGRGRSKSPQPPPVAWESFNVDGDKGEGEVEAGKPGQDPKDVEMEVERLAEEIDEEKMEEIKEEQEQGEDVIVADADGRDVEKKEKMEVTGDLNGADAIDTSGL